MKHTIAEIEVSYRPNLVGDGIKITDGYQAYQVLRSNWNDDTIQLYEQFKVLMVNNGNFALGVANISHGGFTGTVVDMRILFAIVLKCGATGIITAHNHPSGNLKPSESDINIHKKIKEVAKLHDINFIDNLIITESGYYSFVNEGL